MSLYVDDGDLQIHVGDALDVLRGMPDGSVDCCVTSPPYWGLRDYGTGSWDGGDADCDHAKTLVPRALDDPGIRMSTLEGGKKTTTAQAEGSQYRDVCGKCGARRVDQQLGLEATPDEYVTNMVAVFREVRRVLADRGTLWLNLGSSYMANASGGMTGSTLAKGGKQTASSRGGRAALRDARLRDTAGTEPQGSTAPGSACRDLCDGCADAQSIRTADTIPLPDESALPASLTARGSATLGSAPAPRAASLPDAQASTTPESSQPPPGECSHCANCGACLSVLRSSTRDARLCARTEEHTNGSVSLASALRNLGRDASGTAWLNYTRKLKPKDMVPTPWMVAFALQADGWYLRSDIIWAKPNPMPESVTDRPTKAHEYVFLLSKRPRYWFDQEAVREPAEWARWGDQTNGKHEGAGGSAGWIGSKPKGDLTQRRTEHYNTADRYGAGNDGNGGFDGLAKKMRDGEHTGRNVRSVWEIATQPYPDAHFATFPEELPRRCILAGCPEWVCGTCGKARDRIVEASRVATRPDHSSKYGGAADDLRRSGEGNVKFGLAVRTEATFQTVGWSDCGHANFRPGTVLDPFLGSGTTALVARNHGRRSIGIELSPSYADLAARRLQQLSLLADGDAA